LTPVTFSNASANALARSSCWPEYSVRVTFEVAVLGVAESPPVKTDGVALDEGDAAGVPSVPGAADVVSAVLAPLSPDVAVDDVLLPQAVAISRSRPARTGSSRLYRCDDRSERIN
jgi:hypothetical protein